MQRFDAFLESMAQGKFETAGYLLKKLSREETVANQDCLNAFHILYHLKRREIPQARQKLRNDKYFEFLSRVLQAQNEDGAMQDAADSIAIQQPEVFSSNLRI